MFSWQFGRFTKWDIGFFFQRYGVCLEAEISSLCTHKVSCHAVRLNAMILTSGIILFKSYDIFLICGSYKLFFVNCDIFVSRRKKKGKFEMFWFVFFLLAVKKQWSNHKRSIIIWRYKMKCNTCRVRYQTVCFDLDLYLQYSRKSDKSVFLSKLSDLLTLNKWFYCYA